MTDNDVASVMRHLVRVADLYFEYKDLLEDTCFNIPDNGIFVNGLYMELPWLYVWQGLKKFYEEQGSDTAPSVSMLEHYIRENIRINELFIDEELESVLYDTQDKESGILGYLYDDVDLNVISGRPLIRDFLKERSVKDVIRELTSESRSSAEITEQLNKLADKANQIENAGNTCRMIELIPDQCFFDSLPEAKNMVPTGIPFFDAALFGGMRQEVYGICGTTGAGKTTLGRMLFVEGGKLSFADAVLNGTKPKVCLYYTFEENFERLVSHVVGYGAMIKRDQLSMTRGTNFGVKDASTDPAQPKDYERATWPDDSIRKSEVQRLAEFRKWANQTLFIRNFTGVPNSWETKEEARNTRAVGCNGIDGIRMDVDNITRVYGVEVHMIIIDYAYVMCKRQTISARDPERALYSKLRTVADEARTKLVAEFGCPVWILQQITGAFLDSSPLKVPTLADVSDCKAMCNDMAGVWTLGVPDKLRKTERNRSACVYLASVKQRYADGVAPTILQYDPIFPRMNDVSNEYAEDRIGKCFRKKSVNMMNMEVYGA